MVVAASINSDGTLVSNLGRSHTRIILTHSVFQNLDRAVATGGHGAHGQSTGPDALFSQGAIKASAKGKVLATVNVSTLVLTLQYIVR